MSLLSRLFPKRDVPPAVVKVRKDRRRETKSIGVVYPPELFWNWNTLTGIAAQSDPLTSTIGKRRAYSAVALVYACMAYRSTKLSEAALWIIDEQDDGDVWLEGEHELSELLERPNPDMGMAELLEILSLYDDATGGWLLVKNENRGGRVGSMYPYSYDDFAVEPANGRLYGRFRVQTLDGYRTLGPDDVIFFKRASLTSLLSATSRVDAALAHINIGDQMRQTIQQLLRRAVRPGSKLEIPQNYTDDQANRLKADLALMYEGFVNAGKTVLIEGAGKFELLNQGLKDLELGPVQQDVEAAICQCFQVHPGVVAARLGVENSSGFADLVDSATKLFYDVAAVPTWARYADVLTRGLLRPIDANPRRFLKFDTRDVRALQPDMTANVEQASKASAFWTVNEQRAHTGKEKIADGDEIRIPVGPGEEDDEDDPKEPKTKTAFKDRSIRVVTGVAIAAVSLSAAWHDFDQKATREEQRYETAAVAQLERERERVVRTIEDAVPGSKADETDDERLRRLIAASLIAPYLEAALVRIAADYDANGIYHREWQQRFERLVRQTVKIGGRDVAAALGLDFNLQNPRVQQVIRQRVTKLAGEVTETTLGRVRDVIAQARAEGVGIGEISKRIRDDAFSGTITTSRARTIARTETVGALNEGEHLAAVESGVMQSKRWLSQGDGRVRDDHRADNDAGWIPIADRYPNSRLHYPHEPGAPAEQVINCRCSQLFSDLTADEANRETA